MYRSVAGVLLGLLAAGSTHATPSDLAALVRHSLEALSQGGQFDSSPPEARRKALRKLLALQGLELPKAVKLESSEPTKVARSIYAALDASERPGFESSLQGALMASQLRTQTSGSSERTYLVGPRDILAVTVFTQERTQGDDSTLQIPVNSKGDISLPLVGKIRAVGKDVGQIEDAIASKYRRFVKDPQVSVYVLEHRSKRVFVVGQVNQNGEIALTHEKTTLFEVLSRAGGFINAPEDQLHGADPRNIVVQRGKAKIKIDFYGEATDTTTALDFFVQDGDQIFVPKPLNRVRVLGGVQKAGEFELKPGMTLLDAIALAGSFTEKSRRDHVRIISGEGGRENTRYVNATKIFHGREPDVDLQANDVIYVSEW
jgi:polysaccharide export outer membrane protein